MSFILDIFRAFFPSSNIMFDSEKDIPSLTGKVVLVTGANAGIGKQTCIELAKHSPAQIWVGARNVQTGNEAVTEIKTAAAPGTIVKLLKMDVSSLESVQTAAKEIAAVIDRLDILMLNAGMMGGEPGVTVDGYEKQFATNFLGHALLLKLLTPKLLHAASHPTEDGIEPRVVFLSSDGHKSSVIPKGGIDFATLKTAQTQFSGITKYTQSKLADAVYPGSIAKRYSQFTTVAINPGEVSTGLFSKGANGGGFVITLLAKIVAPLMTKPVTEGCKNSLWASTSSDVKNGAYYDPIGKTGGESPLVKDGKLGERLWEWTESELEGRAL